LNIHLANVQAKKSVSGEFAANLKTDLNEQVSSSGNFGLFPLKISGSLDVNDLAIQRYAPYFEKWITFKIENAFSNLSCDFDVSQKDEIFSATATNKEFSIRDLKILDTASKEQWADIPLVTVKGSVFDLENKTIDTGTISSHKGMVRIKRFENGQLNFAGTMASEQPLPKKQQTSKTTALPSWKLSLNQADIKGYQVELNDLTRQDPVKIQLSDIRLAAKDLKNFKSQKGSVLADMKWNSDGKIRIKGTTGLWDLSGDLDIGLEKIDIKSVQPYFTDAIKIAVTKGNINTTGKLALRLAQNQNQVSFSGDTSVTEFVCLDKKTANDFFKCNSFHLSGIQASVMPVAVTIKDIALTDFYSRIIITDTGLINIAGVLKEETQTSSGESSHPSQDTSPAQDPAAAPQINISNVTLQGGNINFSDYQTQPNFTAHMKDIAGSVSGLSSDEKNRADLHLKGIHGQSSPLEIVGKINPLARHKFFDIAISFKDIEMVNFTPYASKFLGYKIEKGTLVLDLEYLIDDNMLKSENRARFDNFTLGESVESKDATSLPVGLAISLLKNSDGQINLDLPVTGQLNDPEFSVAGIIMKMVGNLILKVATSPFSIIGAMFGGGEELGYVDFEFGEARLEPSNFAKLDKLIEILEKKPSVKLEIQGAYHLEKDGRKLREKGFIDLLKAQKLQDVMKSGAGSGDLKTLVIKSEEKEKYIHRAYAKAEFPKPRDTAGTKKDISVDEKAKLLMTHVKVSEDELRLLGMKRSEEIKAYLVSTQKLAKERIYLLEPKVMETKEDPDTSRVNFLLK
ncbi:MAG: DUF748 domain-containing protein, partial [Proteobacteria bacterium]|nr:DUF748 domain-containing protein [Pseudomonadota bacterium]